VSACIRSHVLQTGPSALAVRSTPDLPPSYASVTTVQGTSIHARTSMIIDPPGEDKFEDPPPYSIVIASTNMQNTEVSRERRVPPAFTKKDDAAASTTSASHTCQYPR